MAENANTMKALLDVLAHAVELAQAEVSKEIENESVQENTSPVSQLSYPTLVRFNTIEYTTVSHPEYGSVQIAVMNEDILYKGMDIGKMFGYSGKNYIGSLTQDIRIMLKAPSEKFPNGMRTSFLTLEGVQELFCTRKLNRIPVCKKMFNWLANEIPAELASSQNKSA